MSSLELCYSPNHRILYKCAIFIFISILTLHGTYLGIHNPADVVPDTNILVIARLLACSIGFLIGITLIPKNVKWGLGSKILLFYVLATGISALKSPHPVIVVGYFILLLGACFLMIGLVYYAQNLPQLKNIEKIWFMTASVLVLKDAVTSILFPGMQAGADVVQLGTSVTHANMLSLSAGLLFWISFRQEKVKYSAAVWLLRAFLVYVLVAAVSRTSIASFLIGGLFFFLFKTRDYRIRWIIVFSGIGLLTFLLLSLSFEHEWLKTIVTYMKRGQDTEGLTTFTGRTLVWKYVLNKSLESPIIGHGYGVSRLTIGALPNGAMPAHSHNDLLEVFFNTGLLGIIPFLVMLTYSSKWMINYLRLGKIYSTDFVLHAICTVAMLLVSTIFETRLGGRIEPASLLFFFYLLALDKETHFVIQRNLLWKKRKRGGHEIECL